MGLAAQTERGNVALLRGHWNAPFLDEAYAFPDGAHDDQVDAATGAFNALSIGRDAHSSSTIGANNATIIRRGDLVLRGDRYVDKEKR